MKHVCKHDAETLKELQSLPLSMKIFETRQRITEWVEHWGEDKCYVAFSGGKDSTVLLDIVRRDYPNIPAVFCNTGLEFPEIVQFVRSVDNVVWLKPKMSFQEVIEKYGYPVISKNTAMRVSRLSNPNIKPSYKDLLMGKVMENGKKSLYRLADKWKFLLAAPFKVSDRCCDIMKKDPIKKYERDGRDKPFIGMMASDGNKRSDAWLKTGCNAWDSKRPMSNPLGFWLESDVWKYLENIEYSSIYDMGYDRTGCAFCAFGCHQEQKKGENRFELMAKTHPKLHTYCMNKLGLKDVLEFIGVRTGLEETLTQGELFDV